MRRCCAGTFTTLTVEDLCKEHWFPRTGRPDGNQTVMTDEAGEYWMLDLPAARYTVIARRAGHLALSFGQLQPFDDTVELEVRAGETRESLDFRLPLGGVIAGRIVDVHGDPVPYASVAAVSCALAEGRRHLARVGRDMNARTDDLGRYRLFGVRPGSYCVWARAPGAAHPHRPMRRVTP